MAKKKAKRVNFSKYKPIYDRGFNPIYMEEIQDSLINRGYPEAQRLAALSSLLHESGGDPNAVDATGKFSGIAQWEKSRHPGSKKLSTQITKFLNDMESTSDSSNWTHGGDGIPYIKNAQMGFDSFWNSTSPYEATLYLNKGNIRPAEEQARINRAEEAANMAKHLYSVGGPYNITGPIQQEGISANTVFNANNYALNSPIAQIKSPIWDTQLPSTIDVKVGNHSLANDGPLSNQQLGIKSKTDWNAITGKATAGLGAAMGIAQSAMANAKIKDTTAEQTVIDNVANTTFAGNSTNDLMNQYSTLENIDRTSKNDLTGSTGEKLMNTGKATLSGVQAGMQIGGPIGAIVGGVVGLGSSVGGWIVGDKKAKNEAARLNREATAAEQRRLANFDLAVDNYEQNKLMQDMANYAAEGGKIHIKSSHRGRLTELKKRTGKTESELYNDGNPAHKKMVVFARNARKWKHEEGGPLFNEFSNGVTLINEGGSHEENPYEGIQVGIDPEGIPNMVEEGEVLFNDYVFSNRLKVPDTVRKQYKLRGNKETSFADAAKEVQKMSEEMPNDPIVQRTMELRMNELMQEQEMVRAKKNRNKKNSNKFDVGGFISGLEYVEPVISIGEGIASRFIKPDYSALKPYKQAIKAANVPIGTTNVTSNLKFKPLDKQSLTSAMQASNAANVRNIMNTSGANPLVARAALLANDANYMNQLGKTWRNIEEAEYNRQLAYDQYMTGLANANASKVKGSFEKPIFPFSSASLPFNIATSIFCALYAK